MKGTVLYIEDEAQLLNLVRAVLERSGYRVLGASDGLSGIILAIEEAPDLILLDLNLPTMSGWEVIAKLQGESRLRGIPIVVITGETEEEDKERSLAVGCSGFLRKPLNLKILPELIREYIGGKREEIELTNEKREGYHREHSRRLVDRLQEQIENLTKANIQMKSLNRELERRDAYIVSMQDPLWVLDTEGNTVDFNPALEKFLNCSAEILKKSNVSDFLDRENRAMVEREDEKRLEKEESTVYQLTFTDRKGVHKPAIVSGQPILEDGQFKGTFAVIKDISDRKLLEEKYRSIFINALEGLYQSTLSGRFLTANPALVEILGYEFEEELLELDIGKDVHIDLEQRNKFIDMLLREKMVHSYDVILRKKNGSKVYAIISARLVYPEKSTEPYVEGSLIDVTERKLLEEEKELFMQALEATNQELQEANRLKDEFLATMSHELRTPLNSIIGFSEVLVDGLSGELNEEQAEFIDNIRVSGHHLLELINGILDLSKMRAGMMTINPEEVNLCSLAKEVCSTFLPQSSRNNIQWTMAIPDDEIAIFVDLLRIKQVLLNVIGNSFKFTPEGGHVNFTLKRVFVSDWDEGKYEDSEDEVTNAVMFVIEDTGIGIDEIEKELIFDEFRQVDGSYTRGHGGTGLGLPIAKRLVELHGGDIWVDSKKGHGSTFSVVLPTNGFHSNLSSDQVEAAKPDESLLSLESSN